MAYRKKKSFIIKKNVLQYKINVAIVNVYTGYFEKKRGINFKRC